MSPIGLGVQMLAASMDLPISESIRVIHAALDAGVTLLDVADVYAPNGHWTGQGERLVGEALRQWRGDRDKVIVATKCGHILGAHPRDVTRNGKPAQLRAACEASLRALGAEVIDLYQLHSVDPATPLTESVETLRALQREGKIKAFGLSNVGRSQIQSVDGAPSLASVQNRMSIAHAQSWRTLQFCASRNLPFLAYSPLAREDAGALGQRFEILKTIAARRGVSVQRVALAWLLGLGDTVLPIPGATQTAHVLDNIAAAELELDADERAAIDAAARAAAGEGVTNG